MIKFVHGDIAEQEVDIIVNAANKDLLWEDKTVNGAIHLGGGPELTKECTEFVEKYGEVATTSFAVTAGHNLPCKHVIHALGPVYPCNECAAFELEETYHHILGHVTCDDYFWDVKSIAFPAISTGVFGFPFEEATKIQLEVCNRYITDLDEIRLVYYTKEMFDTAVHVLRTN
jgi:O-acetyl-ADP-ribose deacetylase (regulator of RNase III)